jgi:hypothetical protein
LLGAGFGDLRQDFAGGRIEIGSTKPWPATNSPSINNAVNNGVCAPAIFRVLFSCVTMLLPVTGARPSYMDAARLVRGPEVDKY